jgi:hypothetical protein
MSKARSVALSLIALTSTARAQVSVDEYNGTYVYAPSERDQERIEREIDEATAPLGPVKQKIARSRLEDAIEPYPRIEVIIGDRDVLLRYGQREFELRLDASPVEAVGLNGEDVTTKAWMSGETLTHALLGDRGARYVELHFEQDGAFVVTTIESEDLPHEIQYGLEYRRAE